MELKILQRDEYDIWNEFVDSSPQGSLFSKTWYLDSLGADYYILAVEYKGRIIAGIVLAKNEINTYANPMLDKYLGVLFEVGSSNQHKRESNEYKAMEMIAKECKKIKSFDYYFHPNFDNWIPFSWEGYTQKTRYTYRINYKANTLEEIYSNFHHRIVKNNIKKGQKSGVEIRKNIPFDDLWELVDKTFLRQGSKSPFKKEKLKYYVQTLEKMGVLKTWGTYFDGRCVTAGAVVYEPKSAYFLLNGIDIENMPRGANTYMIYEIIKFFSDKCGYFDFEGSMLPGVEPLYRKFGGERVQYMQIWNDNFLNYAKLKVKKIYKRMRYGR